MRIVLPKVIDNKYITGCSYLNHSAFSEDLEFDFAGVEIVGINFFVILRHLKKSAAEKGYLLKISNVPKQFSSYETIFNESSVGIEKNRNWQIGDVCGRGIKNFFFDIGDKTASVIESFSTNGFLAFYILYSSFFGIFRKKTMKKDEPIKQMVLLGLNASVVVILIMSLLGFVMAVQGVHQLEQFGAGIFVAPMLGLSMVRELGPVMTAVILVGRSGSAVTAEIATMNVNEEIDAIQTMGMDPIQFVVVPRVWAFTVMAPALTVIGTFFGIVAGMVISVIYLQIPASLFFSEMFKIFTPFDIIFNIFKGITFGWLIVIISVLKGLKVKGGAEEVGSATTSSVVTSIFAIAVLNSIYSIVYIVYL